MYKQNAKCQAGESPNVTTEEKIAYNAILGLYDLGQEVRKKGRPRFN